MKHQSSMNEKALKNDQLGVLQNRINDRLQDPPQPRGPTVEILIIGEEAGDIVLSSADKALNVLQIMSSDNEDTVYVDIHQAKGSIASIRTDSLGPCLGFFIRFYYGAQPKCFLDHYSFDIDESSTSLHDIWNVLLKRICLKLRSCLNGMPAIRPTSDRSGVHNVKLMHI
ncbi:unnamed protein product [Adineta ricciae]|uniref:Uncharacterized protein n=1 Tax=Adineta ricciae TaxID=249248 RepID=A0A815YNZ2_ADIRI|nr:unnamed protein product [Adineta ricciae]